MSIAEVWRGYVRLSVYVINGGVQGRARKAARRGEIFLVARRGIDCLIFLLERDRVFKYFVPGMGPMNFYAPSSIIR